jgi:hypothetical protein
VRPMMNDSGEAAGGGGAEEVEAETNVKTARLS